MSDARIVLRKLGMVSKSKERTRRPTKDELDALFNHFFEMQIRRPSSINMPKVLGFAIFPRVGRKKSPAFAGTIWMKNARLYWSET